MNKVVAAVAVLLLAGCSSATDGSGTAVLSSGALSTPAATPPSSVTSSASPSSTSAPTAESVLASMTLAERVGQLFMVDCPSEQVSATTVQAIQTHHVGAVILDGTTTQGLAITKGITNALELSNPSVAKLFIATDQEGGLVQRLQGAGFDTVPSAVVQGGWSLSNLKAHATTWAKQLRAAGVNVDLAPVLDTVPANSPGNPPIGDLDREFGHTPGVVTAHGVAALQGLAAGGVDATIKHFPGLGRVTGNTDTTSGVTDTVTTRHDAYLAPFAAAISEGAPFVMMSTAIYSRIDSANPAAFSPTIITGMLRGDLGFDGIVISDDLGAAKQVASYSLGQRAVRFIAAGGDMVLTVDAGDTAPMTAAVIAKATSDPSFRAKVDAAALRVLKAKQARGLLGL